MDQVTYRYKLSSNIMELITEFSKIHEFEERKDYKDSGKLLSMVVKDEATFGGSNVQRKILKETLERAIYLNK